MHAVACGDIKAGGGDGAVGHKARVAGVPGAAGVSRAHGASEVGAEDNVRVFGRDGHGGKSRALTGRVEFVEPGEPLKRYVFPGRLVLDELPGLAGVGGAGDAGEGLLAFALGDIGDLQERALATRQASGHRADAGEAESGGSRGGGCGGRSTRDAIGRGNAGDAVC